MTSSYNGQFSVTSEEEMLRRFEQANAIDCRINAYPEYTKWEKYGMVTYPPNFLFFDLDLATFLRYGEPKMMLEEALKATLNRIPSIIPKYSQTLLPSRHFSSKISNDNRKGHQSPKESTDVKPTVLWTGNGYHIYLPINAIVLDQENYFSKESFPNLFSTIGRYSNWSVSEVFLKYAEIFFTNGKADPRHMPKYKTCLIRLPGSYNSKLLKKGLGKEEARVKVIQRWNGKRLPIQYLLKDFRRWLVQKEVNQSIVNTKRKYCSPVGLSNTYIWIEKLLETPIEDNRKYCIFHILVPYLTNVRGLPTEEASQVISSWLSKCSLVRPLDFNPHVEIKTCIKYVKHYKPLGLSKLKEENRKLYAKLKIKGF
jgi:hypothetical protein